MMNENYIAKVKEFDADLFASYRSERFEEVEIRLRELQAEAVSAEECDHVLSMYVNHYHFVGDSPRAEQALRQRIALFPDLVEAWIGLTEHFHYHEEDIEKAAETVEIALQKSLKQGRQVRQVLGVRIRIALKRKDYAKVNDSLLKLLTYKLPPEGFDVAFEIDFIPEVAVAETSEDLLRQYKELVKFKG